jgi:hypothetical protein
MRNMETHDNVILLTCGLRRRRVSTERRRSNLDWKFFSYLAAFIIPSNHMLPNPFQFNVHIRLVIPSSATSGIASFSFTS